MPFLRSKGWVVFSAVMALSLGLALAMVPLANSQGLALGVKYTPEAIPADNPEALVWQQATPWRCPSAPSS